MLRLEGSRRQGVRLRDIGQVLGCNAFFVLRAGHKGLKQFACGKKYIIVFLYRDHRGVLLQSLDKTPAFGVFGWFRVPNRIILWPQSTDTGITLRPKCILFGYMGP